MKMFGEAEILSVGLEGFEKPVKEEGVRSGNKTKRLIIWAGLARLAEIFAP